LLLAAGISLGLIVSAAAQEAPDWSHVGKLFAERCTMCHSGDAPPLGLRLDTYEGARKGSQDGPVLIPGDPENSELVRRIRGESEPRMPFGLPPLAPEEIAMIERWVSEGLAGPDAAAEQEEAPESPAGAEAASEQAALGEAGEQAAALPGPGEDMTFAHVGPILMRRCVMCHSDAAAAPPPEGLRLDSYQNVLGGGERVVLLPGRPDHSELVRRIEGTAQPRMPFNGPPWLSDQEIRLIRQWVAEGGARRGRQQGAGADRRRSPLPRDLYGPLGDRRRRLRGAWRHADRRPAEIGRAGGDARNHRSGRDDPRHAAAVAVRTEAA
jgi:cytochrome c5